MDKRSESQWPADDYSDVPENFGHITPEAADEMSKYYAEQDKIAKEQESKQSKNPPF